MNILELILEALRALLNSSAENKKSVDDSSTSQANLHVVFHNNIDAVKTNTKAVQDETEVLKNPPAVPPTVPPPQLTVEAVKTDEISAYDSSETLAGFNRKARWNNLNVGPAFPGRVVVVALGTRDFQAGNEVFINGEKVKHIEAGNGSKALSLIAYAQVDAGNTINLDINFKHWPSDIIGSVYALKNTQPIATGSGSKNVYGTILDDTVEIVPGSVVIATSYIEDWDGSSGITGAEWINASKQHEANSAFHWSSQAILNVNMLSASELTINWNGATNEDASLAAVSFVPVTQVSNNVVNTTPTPVPPPPPSNNVIVTERELTAQEVENIFGPFHDNSSNRTLSYTGGLGVGRTALAPNPDDATDPMLRCLIEGGTRGHIQFNKNLNGNWNEVILEYKIRFEAADGSAMDFKRGGKLPGLAGGTGPTGGKSAADGLGFNTRFMWIEESLNSPNTRFSEYIYDMDGNGDHLYLSTDNPETARRSGGGNQWNRGEPILQGNRWYTLKQHVRMNTPNVPDGMIMCWVDDKLALSMHNVRFRSTFDVGIDTFMFSTFFGGSNTTEWQASKDTYLMFKDFKITIGDNGQNMDIILPKG